MLLRVQIGALAEQTQGLIYRSQALNLFLKPWIYEARSLQPKMTWDWNCQSSCLSVLIAGITSTSWLHTQIHL